MTLRHRHLAVKVRTRVLFRDFQNDDDRCVQLESAVGGNGALNYAMMISAVKEYWQLECLRCILNEYLWHFMRHLMSPRNFILPAQ